MELHEGTAVAAVRAGALELAGGAARAFDECLWCTQAAAPAWLRSTGLPLGAAAPRVKAGRNEQQGREQGVLRRVATTSRSGAPPAGSRGRPRVASSRRMGSCAGRCRARVACAGYAVTAAV